MRRRGAAASSSSQHSNQRASSSSSSTSSPSSSRWMLRPEIFFFFIYLTKCSPEQGFKALFVFLSVLPLPPELSQMWLAHRVMLSFYLSRLSPAATLLAFFSYPEENNEKEKER
uniref:Uncharacterized protein n=1 Tax=Caenorhabditis japonica TaxID=281687 RepID=A0A8R1DXL1_CAEJA